jgi:tight adherence protein C
VAGVNSAVLIAAIALGFGLWSLVTVLWQPNPSSTWVSRLGPYLLDVSERARELHRPVIEDPLVVGGFVVGQGLKSWANRFDRLVGGRESQALLFDCSGRHESFGLFRTRRSLVALGWGLVGVVLGASVAGLAQMSALSGAFAGGLAGIVAALITHDSRLRSDVRLRSERMSEEFPTIIELLGLALAAGDSLPGALERVSKRASGELGTEWARVVKTVHLGGSLTATLRESAHRVGVPHVTAFVEHLAQALDRGAPLAEVVRAHSVDAKADYTRGLVEKAGKAEVAMLVPMVLLILPVTVIFAVYPGLQALQFGF